MPETSVWMICQIALTNK